MGFVSAGTLGGHDMWCCFADTDTIVHSIQNQLEQGGEQLDLWVCIPYFTIQFCKLNWLRDLLMDIETELVAGRANNREDAEVGRTTDWSRWCMMSLLFWFPCMDERKNPCLLMWFWGLVRSLLRSTIWNHFQIIEKSFIKFPKKTFDKWLY